MHLLQPHTFNAYQVDINPSALARKLYFNHGSSKKPSPPISPPSLQPIQVLPIPPPLFTRTSTIFQSPYPPNPIPSPPSSPSLPLLLSQFVLILLPSLSTPYPSLSASNIISTSFFPHCLLSLLLHTFFIYLHLHLRSMRQSSHSPPRSLGGGNAAE